MAGCARQGETRAGAITMAPQGGVGFELSADLPTSGAAFELDLRRAEHMDSGGLRRQYPWEALSRWLLAICKAFPEIDRKIEKR